MIRTQRTRLLMLASLSLLTTLLALSGIGKGSAGAVARNIECSHKLAHHLDLAEGHQKQAQSERDASHQAPAEAVLQPFAQHQRQEVIHGRGSGGI